MANIQELLQTIESAVYGKDVREAIAQAIIKVYEDAQDGGLTTAIKEALEDCFEHVAWVDDQGQTYLDALHDALYADVPATTVILNKYSVSFRALSQTTQLSAVVFPSTTTDSVSWSSSDSSVATVSSSGLVTSVSTGRATITATAGSATATCSVLISMATVVSLTATLNAGNHKFYVGDDINDIKPYLTVKANMSDGTVETLASTDYTLSGSLSNTGANTITVSYGGESTTVSVTAVGLSSITAVYTQSGTVYDTDTLDDLKSDLVVTANYSDSSTATVASTDYTLSGTLTAGTSTITVSYGGKTTTFNVTVTHEASWQDGVPYDGDEYKPLTQNYYWASGGNKTSYNGWDITNYLNCLNASTLYIDRVSGSASIPNGAYCYFFDASKSPIGAFSSYKSSSSTSTHVIINVPSGAKFFSLSESSVQIARFISGEFTITPNA